MNKKEHESIDTISIMNDTELPSTDIHDISIDEVDFNDLLELEKAARKTEEQLNKVSGAIFRLSRDQEVFYNHEKKINIEIDAKRRDLVKRYKLDEQRAWKIDVNTRKVIY